MAQLIEDHLDTHTGESHARTLLNMKCAISRWMHPVLAAIGVAVAATIAVAV